VIEMAESQLKSARPPDAHISSRGSERSIIVMGDISRR
jgi:hypothetical protein